MSRLARADTRIRDYTVTRWIIDVGVRKLTPTYREHAARMRFGCDKRLFQGRLPKLPDISGAEALRAFQKLALRVIGWADFRAFIVMTTTR